MSYLGRLVKRPNATTAHLVASNAPYDAGSAWILASDLDHLGTETARRPLFTGRGLDTVWRSTSWTAVETPLRYTAIDWDSDHDHSLAMGTHALHLAGDGNWPTLKLSCRIAAGVAAGAKVWIYLGIVPGRNAFPSAVDIEHSASTFSAVAGFVTATLSIPLRRQDVVSDVLAVVPGTDAAVAETSSASVFTAWFGAACNSGNKLQPAQALGVSLWLEP